MVPVLWILYTQEGTALVLQPHLASWRTFGAVVALLRSCLMAATPCRKCQRLFKRVRPPQHQPHQQPAHFRYRQRDQLWANFFSTGAEVSAAPVALARHRNAARTASANIDKVM